MTNGSFSAYWCTQHDTSFRVGADALLCPVGHAVPVRASIPRFVSGSTYADLFGAQWKRFRRTQLDSYTGTTISRDRTRRALGEDAWAQLRGSQVLECGCGAGRFTEVLLDEGACVTSIDLSDAVEANQDNFPQGERHRIAQADILNLPFAPRQFDVVFCLGVVQHTKRPEETVAALFEHVRPGGALVFDHYCFQVRRFTQLAPIFRFVLKRLPPTTTIPVTSWMVDHLLPLHKRAGRFAPLVSRISPVASYYRTYPELSDELQREWSLLDTHDSLTDWYKRLRSRKHVEQMMLRLGATVDRAERAGNGIEARCRRPV